MEIFFKHTKRLASQIDEFLDSISEGMLIFMTGIKSYLANNEQDFEERIAQIGTKESNADKLRRNIENQIYVHSLIPGYRGDVMKLLETMDQVINTAKKTLNQFDVERPNIPDNLHDNFVALTEACIKSAEMIVRSTRSFFRDINDVKNHLHKVYHYEKEADKLGDRLKREIFATDLKLSQKNHLRYFTLHIENISDRAEEVADLLSIYVIKRHP